MIEKYLSNKNESDTVSKFKNFFDLNKALVPPKNKKQKTKKNSKFSVTSDT